MTGTGSAQARAATATAHALLRKTPPRGRSSRCARRGPGRRSCGSRSTPALACPPEANAPVLCAGRATAWCLAETAPPLAQDQAREQPGIPAAAVTAARDAAGRTAGSCLARCGKELHCGESLGTAQYADLLGTASRNRSSGPQPSLTAAR